MKFRPIGSQILLEYEENKPLGDLVLPDTMDTFDFSFFVVCAVGEGFLTVNGYVPVPVKVGDRVQLRGTAKGNLMGLTPYFVDDRKLAVVDVSHVMGVWEGELPSQRIDRKIVRDKAVFAS